MLDADAHSRQMYPLSGTKIVSSASNSNARQILINTSKKFRYDFQSWESFQNIKWNTSTQDLSAFKNKSSNNSSLWSVQWLMYHRACKPDFLCSWPSLNSYLE